MTSTSQPVRLLKGHGTENDFLILVDCEGTFPLDASTVSRWCDRRAGLGADGILRIMRTDVALADPDLGFPTLDPPAVSDDAPFAMDYRNADGSIAEMCGNGARVFAHALLHQGLLDNTEFGILTRAGIKTVTVEEFDRHNPDTARVSIEMGSIDVYGTSTCSFEHERFAGVAVNVGNPHLACVIPGLTPKALAELPIATPPDFDHEFFPQGTNIEILTPLRTTQEGRDEVHMRVHERGSGETRSCGTGTVAATIAALATEERTSGTVDVLVPGGVVTVTIDEDMNATLTGPSVIHSTIDTVL